ncbi:MAG: winged helix-turn-helix domain-containing protein [Betaproteobacteria bacterium]
MAASLVYYPLLSFGRPTIVSTSTISHEASAAQPVSRIGEWSVRPAANELGRNGDTLRLEPKVMEVLMLLAEHAGEVVSREALLSAIWQNTMVGDDALTQAVIKLRKSLQDTARASRYIETISKRGYRLIAPVERLGSRQPQTAAPTGPAVLTQEPVRRWMTGALAVSLGLVVSAWIAVHISAPQDTVGKSEATILKDAADPWNTLPTIVITPFETVAADGAESYLARGLAADLMTDLSRLNGLRVISFPRHGLSLETTREPIARYSLSGTVQRVSESLRINVRLVDNGSNRQLWAKRYDRPVSDLKTVQEEIISRLLQELPVQVSEAERQRLARRYTRNPDAYEFFLRGKAAFLARQPSENLIAREMYQKAIDLDPTFARAYAGLALTHADDYRNQWTNDGQQSLAKALQLAQSALRMDPDIPDVYAVLGYVHAMRLDYKEAVKVLTKAIELDHSYADAYAYLGAFYVHMGQPDKSIALLRTAMRLNPESGFIYFVVLGRAYLFQGDTGQAMVNLREAINRNAGDLEARVFMAASMVAAGDVLAARWEAEEIRAIQPEFTARRWLQTYPMSDARQRETLLSLLTQLGL